MRRTLTGLILFCAACGGSMRPAPAAFADSGFVAVDGGRLYYEVAGEGPPVVLLHGGFGDRRMWDAQWAALARSFRVVRYDHRGFGRSPAPDGAYSPVGDLLRLLDHLGIQRAHLVGNSMGAGLALDFAVLQPERTGRVVAIASGANGYPFTEADAASVMAVFGAARDRGTAAAAELWLRHPMVGVSSTRAATAPLLRRMVVQNQRMFLLEHWPAEAMSPTAYERLGELRAPVLFVVGDRDTELVQRVARASADRVPGARLEVIPGTDHLPQMLEPERINWLVIEFLSAGVSG